MIKNTQTNKNNNVAPVIQKPARPFHLSASRIKKYESCSWQYYCSYVLKLDSGKTSGASRGNICHTVFECLLNFRHKSNYDRIIQNNHISGDKAVDRLVKQLIKREELSETDNKGNHNYDLINSMILVGLNYDFYCSKDDILLGAEQEIKLHNKEQNKEYNLTGFIDKLAIKNGIFKLYDYKSSQNLEDYETQALCYTLWCKKEKQGDAVATFLFLRFGEGVNTIHYKFTDAEIEGFEIYLNTLQKKLENFTEKDGMEHFAYDDGFPKPGEGFSGASMCGRSKEKGQLKKNGELMWSCFAKFPSDYYEVFNVDENYIEKSFFELTDALKYVNLIANKSKNLDIREKHYKGCPRFYRENY